MAVYDQAAFAQRVQWCYFHTQTMQGGYITLADYGEMVAEEEGRPRPYAASSVQAWMVPGGSMPDSPGKLAIARLAGADPGWLDYGAESAAPAPEGWQGETRRSRR